MTIKKENIPTISEENLRGFVWKRDPRAYPYVCFERLAESWPIDRDEDYFDHYQPELDAHDPKFLLIGYGPIEQDNRRWIAFITEVDHEQRLARFGFENPDKPHLFGQARNSARYLPRHYEVVIDG